MTPVEVVALHGCSRPEGGRACPICLESAEGHVRAVREAGLVVSLPAAGAVATPAEPIEAALREHMRLKITPTTIEHAQRGWPIWISGGEAEDAARIAVDALAGAGLVVVSVEDLRAYLYRGKDLKAEVAAMNRLRAVLSERNDHA